jgi:hypothetical protein
MRAAAAISAPWTGVTMTSKRRARTSPRASPGLSARVTECPNDRSETSTVRAEAASGSWRRTVTLVIGNCVGLLVPSTA